MDAGAVAEVAAEVELVEWRRVVDQRDELVRRAVAAGVSQRRITKLTGISRTTITRILETTPID